MKETISSTISGWRKAPWWPRPSVTFKRPEGHSLDKLASSS